MSHGFFNSIYFSDEKRLYSYIDVYYIFYLNYTYFKSVLKSNGRIYIDRWKDVIGLQ